MNIRAPIASSAGRCRGFAVAVLAALLFFHTVLPLVPAAAHGPASRIDVFGSVICGDPLADQGAPAHDSHHRGCCLVCGVCCPVVAAPATLLAIAWLKPGTRVVASREQQARTAPLRRHGQPRAPPPDA